MKTEISIGLNICFDSLKRFEQVLVCVLTHRDMTRVLLLQRSDVVMVGAPLVQFLFQMGFVVLSTIEQTQPAFERKVVS